MKGVTPGSHIVTMRAPDDVWKGSGRRVREPSDLSQSLSPHVDDQIKPCVRPSLLICLASFADMFGFLPSKQGRPLVLSPL